MVWFGCLPKSVMPCSRPVARPAAATHSARRRRCETPVRAAAEQHSALPGRPILQGFAISRTETAGMDGQAGTGGRASRQQEELQAQADVSASRWPRCVAGGPVLAMQGNLAAARLTAKPRPQVGTEDQPGVRSLEGSAGAGSSASTWKVALLAPTPPPSRRQALGFL